MAKKPSAPKLPIPLIESLRDLTVWLEAEKIQQVIIGGVAVALIAQPRMTEDIDAVISLDTDLLESFLSTAGSYGFVPRISDAADFARRHRVILLQHQPTGINIDLSCGVLPFEEEMILRARPLTIGSLKIKVATPEDLVIMKAVAHRPRDIADIEAILNIEPTLDLERVRRWVSQFAEALEMPELLEDLEKLLRR
ncbi:MAG: nucleotidyltransferase [Acidobacteriota bacterium]|nr:nucleotidyltransferase [Acidobacteriota bacterium]